MTRTVIVCGKGGIGKSTVASNLSLLLARAGRKVLQVGCDPKHDSCAGLVDRPPTTVMQSLVDTGRLDRQALRRLVVEGREGVRCLEMGGPQPGIGCAGRGLSLALDCMNEDSEFFGRFEVRIFDLIGDVVCGGFAMPMRAGPNAHVYLVVSGELMALYAANNIARGIVNLARRGGGRLAGVIANLRGSAGERELVWEFARALGTEVASWIPQDVSVSSAELEGSTVAARFPKSAASRALGLLAEAVLSRGDGDLVIPAPMADEDLKARCRAASRRGARA